MGFIVIIIIVVVMLALYGAAGDTSGNNTSSSSPSSSGYTPPSKPVDNTFKIRVKETQESIEGIPFNLFVIEMRGAIRAPYNNYTSTKQLLAFDVTDGDDKPLISAIEGLQLPNTVAFGLVSEEVVPYEFSIISDWITVLKIPIDMLTPPRKGERKIRFTLLLSGTDASARASIRHEFYDFGYLDAKENRKEFPRLAVELAFAVCSSDGEINIKEAAVIKDWVKKRIEMALDDEQKSLKNLLNQAIQKSYSNFEAGIEPSYSSLTQELKKVSTVAQRYEALELGLKVAAADGIAEKAELDLLDKLATFLGVDQDKFRATRDKHLTVTMISDDAVSVDNLLGLKPGMTVSEKKKHLREEYNKWNQLAEHTDPKKREQAKEMLDIIAQKRSELIKESA